MVPTQHELKSRPQVVNLIRCGVVNLDRNQVVSFVRWTVVSLTEFSRHPSQSPFCVFALFFFPQD